jgi:hypothetical protein
MVSLSQIPLWRFQTTNVKKKMITSIEKIIKAVKPSERSLITVKPCGDKVLIIVEPVKVKNKKKHTAARQDLG